MLCESKAQNLHPDSLMYKVEQFGTYLLYRNHDSTYITNFSDKFTLKLIGVNKINYFKIRDRGNNTSIRFRPDRRLNLGFGISYKWFALDLAFKAGIAENSDFQNSKFLDFQGSIFSSKQYISATYQYYYGYQMSKLTGISTEDYPSSNIRDDIRTTFIGLKYLFAFSYDKFSLKAPFIHNEIQRKSAGSFLLGGAFNMYNMVSDSSIVPQELQDNFNENLYLTDLNVTILAVNFGYMYTFVWRENFFVTASLIPGIGLNIGDYQTDFRQPYKTHLYLGLSTMNSIGYNSEKMFGGIQFVADTFSTRIEKQLNITTGSGKVKLFFGYRFG